MCCDWARKPSFAKSMCLLLVRTAKGESLGDVRVRGRWQCAYCHEELAQRECLTSGHHFPIVPKILVCSDSSSRRERCSRSNSAKTRLVSISRWSRGPVASGVFRWSPGAQPEERRQPLASKRLYQPTAVQGENRRRSNQTTPQLIHQRRESSGLHELQRIAWGAARRQDPKSRIFEVINALGRTDVSLQPFTYARKLAQPKHV